ncbi:response regulator transcription factor [Schaalia hyovaginalis]|uniref:response regulator transcription factor n=1 Tax=Schaalia hyovaginalis TaxID=29316 RepID=UPI0023F639CA|nr:response regulator transcription factor [Schaalia hyovaginalis]MCI6556744.1 response regulator transcription factor [Schaalia hyovaginalis]MCI7672410.1 response regulator transcription factor [Schaalia hyovaginalis]MDD7554294.1 response regulator transcription factor [Schaalia hyovaginalis]MDY3093338.1 response regulator transcription factor [Schaalia hyovaginalis]MDY5506333.1 response regulator transcription factor [Schaalia hyovaginalis]
MPENERPKYSVLVVEDQMLLLDALVKTINAHEDLEVIGGIVSALDAVEACARLRPDLLLMDICTDGGASGLAACKEVVRTVPSTRVVLMTAMPDLTFPEEARKAGAVSFIYKDVSSQELTSVLKASAEGYSTYPARPSIPFLGYNELTEREIAVLRQTCAGRTRAEIADLFGLSENTIKTNISSILTKTGFRSITRLALYAMSSGYIVVDEAESAFGRASGGEVQQGRVREA